MRSILSGVSLALTLYIALAPRLAKPLYRPLLFRPDILPEDLGDAPIIDGIAGRDINFRARNGKVLHGWFFSNRASRYLIHFSHGNAGNIVDRTDLVRLLLKAGASVFIYDYQGYGKSEGRPDLPDVCHDAEAAYDYLVKEEEISPDRIVLYGESLGASVACYLSSQRACAGLIMQSGFSSLRRIAGEEYPFLRWYPRWLYPVPPLDSIEILKKPHPPVLIAHGVHDIVIPYQHGEELFDEAIEPKFFVKLSDCAHSDIASVAPDQYIEEIRQFLELVGR